MSVSPESSPPWWTPSLADVLRALALLLRQLGSPIVLILIAAALLSFAMRDATDGFIILVIVGASSLLGFWQEYRAVTAMARLQQMGGVRAEVLRDGQAITVPVAQVVPGDVVLLSAGTSVPADCRLLEERDLFTNEATLTGETFPVEKTWVRCRPTRRWRAAAMRCSWVRMW